MCDNYRNGYKVIKNCLSLNKKIYFRGLALIQNISLKQRCENDNPDWKYIEIIKSLTDVDMIQ